MDPNSRAIDEAFRVLARRRAARRFAALNGRMRVLVLLLAGYLAAFTYWQARVPLDGLRRARGEGAVVLALAIGLAAIAALGALTAAWRRAALAARVPGPEWLALPVPPAAVQSHLHAEARAGAAAAVVPAAAALLAGIGLVRPWRLGLLALGFALVAAVFARLATSLAAAAVVRRARAGRPLPRATRELLVAARPDGAPPRPAPRWRREPPWRALVRLDTLVSSRRSAARTRLVIALAGFALGAAAWFAPAPALTRRALAYAGFGAACAALGGWAIARTCADPASALLPLPLGVRNAWRARATAIAVLVAGAVVLNAALAFALPPLARVGIAIAWFPSGFAVALLGMHYALSLSPRAAVAENLFYGWLAVALIASWMIPFLGWAVLLAGLAHSSRRLANWQRPEIA